MNSEKLNPALFDSSYRATNLDDHSNPQKRSWFAVYTGAQQEKKLTIALNRRRILHYLPLVQKKRQWSDRVKIIESPLLKGYLFVDINWLTQKRAVLEMPGVVGFVKSEGLPVVIDQSVVDSLKILVQGAQEVRTDPYHGFPPGKSVVIDSGPLKGFQGYIKKVNSKTNVMVVIEALGQVISGSFHPQDLTPV